MEKFYEAPSSTKPAQEYEKNNKVKESHEYSSQGIEKSQQSKFSFFNSDIITRPKIIYVQCS